MCALNRKEKKGIIFIRYEGSGFLALSICFSANPLPGTISQFVTCLSLFLLSSTSYCFCYFSLFLLFIVIFSSYYFLFIFIVVLSLIVVIARFCSGHRSLWLLLSIYPFLLFFLLSPAYCQLLLGLKQSFIFILGCYCCLTYTKQIACQL